MRMKKNKYLISVIIVNYNNALAKQKPVLETVKEEEGEN